MSKHIKSISNPKLKLEILTTEEVRKIHEATLWIIEHVGVRFPSQRALDIWEANGATVDREKKIVRVKGDVIEEALKKLFPSVARVHGSSRTDTGVHALGMVAHVEISKREFRMPNRKLVLALNAFLPLDIRVMSATRARADFHARFNAKGKQYRYFLWNHTSMNPLLRTQAWHVPLPLDFGAMQRAAKTVLGKHDFKSFAAG